MRSLSVIHVLFVPALCSRSPPEDNRGAILSSLQVTSKDRLQKLTPAGQEVPSLKAAEEAVLSVPDFITNKKRYGSRLCRRLFRLSVTDENADRMAQLLEKIVLFQLFLLAFFMPVTVKYIYVYFHKTKQKRSEISRKFKVCLAAWAFVACFWFSIVRTMAGIQEYGFTSLAIISSALIGFGIFAGIGIVLVQPIIWHYLLGERARIALKKKQEELVKMLECENGGPNLILQVQSLQSKMVEAFVKASMVTRAGEDASTPDTQACEDLLRDMKQKASEASKKVASRIEEVLQVYEESSHYKDRFAHVMLVKSFSDPPDLTCPCQPDIPVWHRLDEEDVHGKAEIEEKASGTLLCAPSRTPALRVDDAMLYWRTRANWSKGTFSKIMVQLCSSLNECKDAAMLLETADLRETLDSLLAGNQLEAEAALSECHLNESHYKVDRFLKKNGFFVKGCAGPHCGLQMGALKITSRSKAKVVDKYVHHPDTPRYPRSQYVTDWLRARIIFADPFALYLFYVMLFNYKDYGFQIIRVDNRYSNAKLPRTARTNIFVNFCFEMHGFGHVGEMQLMLQDFLLCSELEHKFFEIKRADDFRDLLVPIFKPDHWASKLSHYDGEKQDEHVAA